MRCRPPRAVAPWAGGRARSRRRAGRSCPHYRPRRHRSGRVNRRESVALLLPEEALDLGGQGVARRQLDVVAVVGGLLEAVGVLADVFVALDDLADLALV